MADSLWKAAALGLLGVPASAATLFFWIFFGVGTAMAPPPRVRDWFARRGWTRAFEVTRMLLFFGAGAAAFGLGAAAAVGVPASLAWWIWHDALHATVAGGAGAAPLLLFFGLSGWRDRRRQDASA